MCRVVSRVVILAVGIVAEKKHEFVSWHPHYVFVVMKILCRHFNIWKTRNSPATIIHEDCCNRCSYFKTRTEIAHCSFIKCVAIVIAWSNLHLLFSSHWCPANSHFHGRAKLHTKKGCILTCNLSCGLTDFLGAKV